MNTMIAFLLGSFLGGTVGFFFAACFALEREGRNNERSDS